MLAFSAGLCAMLGVYHLSSSRLGPNRAASIWLAAWSMAGVWTLVSRAVHLSTSDPRIAVWSNRAESSADMLAGVLMYGFLVSLDPTPTARRRLLGLLWIAALLTPVTLLTGLISTSDVSVRQNWDGTSFYGTRLEVTTVMLVPWIVANYTALILQLRGMKIAPEARRTFSVAFTCFVTFAFIDLADGLRIVAVPAFMPYGFAIVALALSRIDALRQASAEHALERSNTLLAQQNRTLDRALSRSSLAVQTRDRFLEAMSHELRTPLSTILGSTRLLREQEMSHGGSELLENVEEAGEHLLELVSDVLDLAALQDEEAPMASDAIGIEQLVERIVGPARRVAARKKITLNVRLESGLPRQVVGDDLRVGQVLHALVSNAVKFTDAGSVEVEVTRVDETVVRFAVLDTGPGIPPENHQDIFEPFWRLESGLTRNHGGVGLGLALARSWTHRMGGRIGVRERSQTGTIVWVELPLPPRQLPPGVSSRPGVIPPAAGLALLAEDNHINRAVLSRLLVSRGWEVVAVADGQQAVDALCEGLAPDVVLLDIQMPVLDGYGACSFMRTSGFSGPIIAVTAHALPEDRKRATEAGMDAFLSKPVDLDSLLSTIRELRETSR